MYYNVRKKSYPDGTVQYMFSEQTKERDYKAGEKKRTGETIERKEKDNAKRAVQVVYDLARSNLFDLFITLTFNPEKVNSFDYNECAKHVVYLSDRMYRRGCSWLMVPEQHKSGRYHFHGLVKGDLPLVSAVDPYTKMSLCDEKGRQIYNIDIFEFGFTTATKISDPARAANYIAKYLTKEISVPKGKKRYWASRSLVRPVEELLVMSSQEYGDIYNSARYQKVIDSSYGIYGNTA